MFLQTNYFLKALVPSQNSFEEEFLAAVPQKLVLTGYSRKSLAPILNNAITLAKEKDLPIEVIHHPLDNAVQGIFLPTRATAIYCEDFFKENVLCHLTDYAEDACENLHAALYKAKTSFEKAHKLHDSKEEIYTKHMDFELADILADAVTKRLLRNQTVLPFAEGSVKHRYFGAPLAAENIDYIENLTGSLGKRYLIKGRPGSGKSTFLKRIAKALTNSGIDLELYHCSMDANSLDMVVARELDVCLFDCTPPHAYAPLAPRDEVIDLYKECLPPDIDKTFAAELQEIDLAYKAQIEEGRQLLKALLDAEEALYEALPPVSEKQKERLSQTICTTLFSKNDQI